MPVLDKKDLLLARYRGWSDSSRGLISLALFPIEVYYLVTNDIILEHIRLPC